MNTEGRIIFTGLVVLGVAIAFGIITLVWLLWTWVMPQIWTTGPVNFIEPNYWLFIGMWILFVTILKVIKGGKE